MVYAEFGGQTECVMGNWKIENKLSTKRFLGLSWCNSDTYDWLMKLFSDKIS